MERTLKRKVIVVAILVAIAAFAGGAYAANQNSQTSPRKAFLRDVAKRLNVTPQQLRGALQGAFLDQLNAAVAAGKLTQAQANAIKQRLQRGGFDPGLLGPRRGLFHAFRAAPGGFGHGFAPRIGPGGPAGRGPGGPGRFSAAAQYLGLTPKQLLQQLAAGKSLAQVAQARGKSVSGLESAMQAAIKVRLDAAVKAKLITPAQESKFLANLPARLNAQINRQFKPGSGGPGGLGGAGGWRGRGGRPPGPGRHARSSAPPLPLLPGGPAGLPAPPAPPSTVY